MKRSLVKRSLVKRSLANGLRQGRVYWLAFGPARGSAPADRHPCVVVQNDVFNRSAIATTVVCLITSNLTRANAPGNVLLKKGDAGLPKTCVVNVSQVLTVDKADLAEYIGKLSAPPRCCCVRRTAPALRSFISAPTYPRSAPSRSATISSTASIPTDNRTRFSLIPSRKRCFGDRSRCDAIAG